MLLTEESEINPDITYAIVDLDRNLIVKFTDTIKEAYDRVSYENEIVVARLFGSILGQVRKNGTYIDSDLQLPEVIDSFKPQYHSKPGLLLPLKKKEVKNESRKKSYLCGKL